jgi:predicted AAA+ superfamily ATPase
LFVDRHPDRRVLVLGSPAPEMLRQSSVKLAGRMALCHPPPFTLDETGADTVRRMLAQSRGRVDGR